MHSTRRDFLQFTASGIAVTVVPIGFAHGALLEEKIHMPTASPETARLKRRMDGFAKVTGGKVFARDIRARDMAAWPDDQAHAFMIFADRADAPFVGLDFSVLGKDLQPDVIVTAADTLKAGLDFYDAFTFGDQMLLPEG